MARFFKKGKGRGRIFLGLDLPRLQGTGYPEAGRLPDAGGNPRRGHILVAEQILHRATISVWETEIGIRAQREVLAGVSERARANQFVTGPTHRLAQPQLRIGLESLAPVGGFSRIHNDVPFLGKRLWTSPEKMD